MAIGRCGLPQVSLAQRDGHDGECVSRIDGNRLPREGDRALEVQAGHVAGWVGVGGPGQGPDGEDAWIQVGIASMPGMEPFLYAEFTRGGRAPQFILLEASARIGQSRNLAVLEMGGKPGYWRVWVDGTPRTAPVKLRGSSGRWAPIATAESWNGGQVACNRFSFRFERTSISYGGGGSWRPFVPGYNFLDGDYTVRDLAKAPAATGAYGRRLASSGRPHSAWRTFGVEDLNRFPSPAARTTAARERSLPGILSRRFGSRTREKIRKEWTGEWLAGGGSNSHSGVQGPVACRLADPPSRSRFLRTSRISACRGRYFVGP